MITIVRNINTMVKVPHFKEDEPKDTHNAYQIQKQTEFK